MALVKDFVDLFLPNLTHWLVWLVFFIVVAIIVFIYSYPYYFRKQKKEFHYQNIVIPITSIICLYIFTKLYEGIVYEGSILKVDLWFNQAMVGLHTPVFTSMAVFFSTVGGTTITPILITIAIVALFLMKRWRFGLLSVAAIAGSTILQTIFKNGLDRVRPTNSLETIVQGVYQGGFPSGHAITATVFFCLLVYSYKGDIKHRGTKYTVITLFTSFFVIIGFSRIYLNVHWFSDVIGGMALGIFWFMLVVLVEKAIGGLDPAIKKETKEAEPIISKK